MIGPIAARFGIATYSSVTSTSQSLVAYAEKQLEEAENADWGRVAC